MAKENNLMDRVDTIRANSVSDKEFEQTWGRSLDKVTEKLVARWDDLQGRAKEAIEARKQ